MLKRVGTVLVLLLAGCALVIVGIGRGWFGRHLGPGQVTAKPAPAVVISGREAVQKASADAVKAPSPKQILFGDFHVHTTFSADAFLMSLPMQNGEGAHPPADACDFARYCSALDFWSINDHVERLTPAQWQETKETIRQCNAAAGDPNNPDLVSFLGWEWTQVGATRETHWGHKNVIFLDTADDKTPTRPIGAAPGRGLSLGGPGFRARVTLALLAPGGDRRSYLDYARYIQDRVNLEPCPKGVDVHDLPLDCSETAATPAELFEKLDQWGFPALVIPHGTTWGFYTPPGGTLDKQLVGRQHDPKRQRLFEIYSGHGNSEEYRDWRAVRFDDKGRAVCPEPTAKYEPSCWRAGEIIRKRCKAAGESAGECEKRAVEARKNYVAAGVSGFRTVPGARVEDWLDAGQCKDCFLPAFNLRPAESAQYALAITNFDDPAHPRRFKFGFMASSDNHKARAGTGFKEIHRRPNIEGGGPAKPGMFNDPELNRAKPTPYSVPFDLATSNLSGFQLVEVERQVSFLMTGGLVAVHSAGRDRKSIWNALEQREVYGTSGDRILLWFDMLDASGAEKAPMGSQVAMKAAPRFVVRAVGAFKQKPGCPQYSVDALGPERLERLCKGECYNPSDDRKLITRIEVIRILPQQKPGEAVGPLIKDPWRTFACPDSPDGCVVEFEDPEFPTLARDATYYVRAIEEPSPAINGKNLRCEYDDKGNCIKVHPCYTDYRTDYNDDCLADVEERAWSSPIYVAYGE